MEEDRDFRMRLRYHAPEGPIGPTEGFIGDAIRLEAIGFCTYLDLAGSMGNSAGRKKSTQKWRGSGNYTKTQDMNRWEEYSDAYANYIETVRDTHPESR